LAKASGGLSGETLNRMIEIRRQKLGRHADRLSADGLTRDILRRRECLENMVQRLKSLGEHRNQTLRNQIASLERMRGSLGYEATLERGYAVVRGDGAVVKTVEAAAQASAIEIQFADGRMTVGQGVSTAAAPSAPATPKPAAKPKPKKVPPPEQGNLF
jgi:exodeoxyribonuclease VII large subunit